jgi:hypothetical protein
MQGQQAAGSRCDQIAGSCDHDQSPVGSNQICMTNGGSWPYTKKEIA